MSLVVPPYPPARYTAKEPEISAWLKRADQPPDFETSGVKYHYLANQRDTAGDYGLSSYNAAKAGVINLTRSAAIENARHNIRVNCVCPGFIDTRATEILGRDRADELRRVYAEAHPIGRVGQADEIASTVLFLSSDEASFITGAAVVADGGLTAHTGLPHFQKPPPYR